MSCSLQLALWSYLHRQMPWGSPHLQIDKFAESSTELVPFELQNHEAVPGLQYQWMMDCFVLMCRHVNVSSFLQYSKSDPGPFFAQSLRSWNPDFMVCRTNYRQGTLSRDCRSLSKKCALSPRISAVPVMCGRGKGSTPNVWTSLEF